LYQSGVPLTVGLNDMRNALWFAGLRGANGGVASVEEPPRGPAATTRTTLNVALPWINAARDVGVGELRAAMQITGLSRR
jgi:hypothetical protein